MSQPKLCKDCRWVKRDAVYGIFGTYKFAKCLAPQTQETGGQLLVDGTSNDPLHCTTHRNVSPAFGNYCGAEGRFWEAKEEKCY